MLICSDTLIAQNVRILDLFSLVVFTTNTKLIQLSRESIVVDGKIKWTIRKYYCYFITKYTATV